SYSISDVDLESRGFILRRTPADLNLDDLNKVFVAVGFPKRDTDKIRVALDNTDALLWIEYEKTRRPVAFARATGDGVFNAIIWDVVVDPSFQGIGLGKAVMERLLEELLEKGITNIALYSEPRVLGFYRPMGFVADPDGIRGMVIQGLEALYKRVMYLYKTKIEIEIVIHEQESAKRRQILQKSLLLGIGDFRIRLFPLFLGWRNWVGVMILHVSPFLEYTSYGYTWHNKGLPHGSSLPTKSHDNPPTGPLSSHRPSPLVADEVASPISARRRCTHITRLDEAIDFVPEIE
ncbi:hypothetical protein TorRG33x02_340590, partial [Trema orientale]